MRIDIELLNRKMFESRNKAQIAIKSGCIYVNNKKITQSSFDVTESDTIIIKGKPLKYVSKGGLKLEKIIKNLKLDLSDKILVDVGASTGGFTDCAIQNGIKKVYTIDVGTNQLHPSLKKNDKIITFENSDFKEFDTSIINDSTICAIDVSFISALKMLPKLNELENLKEIILLIKPQFECGKEYADKYKGIILNKDIHYNILTKVVKEFKKSGYYCNYLTHSPINGSKGNIEYLAYFTTQNNQQEYEYRTIINKAFIELNKSKKHFNKC